MIIRKEIAEEICREYVNGMLYNEIVNLIFEKYGLKIANCRIAKIVRREGIKMRRRGRNSFSLASRVRRRMSKRMIERCFNQMKEGNMDPRIPNVGSELNCHLDGQTHKVEITNEGFIWNGKAYHSLSSVANAIKGCRVSYPYEFFGLGSVRRTKAEPGPDPRQLVMPGCDLNLAPEIPAQTAEMPQSEPNIPVKVTKVSVEHECGARPPPAGPPPPSIDSLICDLIVRLRELAHCPASILIYPFDGQYLVQTDKPKVD